MSGLDTKINKLEQQAVDGDLADFMREMFKALRPDIQPPCQFESLRGQSVREYFANAKVLRPKILEEPSFYFEGQEYS